MVKALKLVKWDGHPEEETFPSIFAYFDVQRCKLKDIFWRGVNLRNVDLYGSDLSNASLRCADLRNAVLYEANLVRCKFMGANLEKANLEWARIEAADFSGAKLGEAKLTNAVFDDRTKWTDAFDAIASGAVRSGAPVPPSTLYPY
jgi:uncharacterized protein YjbI with pentapeptide repeats